MKVSVCICTCNRPELLARLLDSLQGVELGDLGPGNLDIVVVDNNPTGEVGPVCESASGRLPIAVHFAEEHQRGISFARNRAVDTALAGGADFVAFVDDDDLPEPDWLIELIEKQQKTGADVVFGTWRLDAELPGWLRDTGLFKEPRHDKPGAYGLPKGVATCNVLIGRSIIDKLAAEGPVFCPEFSFVGGEDKDFFIRARESGAVFASAEKSIVNRNHEDCRLTFRGILRRGFHSGCSKMHMTRRHGTRGQSAVRGMVALLRVVFRVLSLPLFVFSKGLLMRHLYRLSTEIGVLYYGLTGRKFHYYLGPAR
jgi:glycosyltransferase involved in cell wall biosynthesis